MADRPPILPSDAPEQRETRTPSDREDMHRTEAYIGSFVQVRAKELGITVSDSQVRDITSGVTGRLTPAQRAGTTSINMADVSGAIEAELRRQSEIGKPVNMYSAEAARLEAQNGGRMGAHTALFPGNSIRGRGDTDNGSGETASSRRFDGINQGYTETQKQALDLAHKVGLGWAANNPDLLRLGPSAIQALADVHLRQDSYERFKNGGLGVKAIVAGARYAKKHHIDYNEASKAYEDTHQSLAPADQKVHSEAITKFNESAGRPNATPADEETAKKELNKKMDELKDRNPSAKQKIEHEQKVLKTVKEQEHAVTANTEKKQATRDADKAIASKDVVAKQSTKSKLLSSLD